MNSFCVYVHSRMSTGEPFYVGKGTPHRAHRHDGRSDHWRRIVAKDGGRYINYVAKDLDEDLAFLVETELIDKYRRLGVLLTNRTDGGEGMSGYRFTPEQSARRSESKRGNTNWLGRKMSEESLARMRASARARIVWPKLTEEHKRKIGEASRGNKYNLGRKASAETRAKLSAIHKGKQHTLGHVLTEEHKAKVSASLIGNKRNLGNKSSEETRLKQSAAHKAAWERRKSSQ